MEAALVQDDPRLVSTLSGKIRAPQGNRVVAGLVSLFGGMAIILAGLVAKIPAVGIAGFIIALVAAIQGRCLADKKIQKIGTLAT